WTSGNERHSELAGQFCVRLGHVDRCALVADIDDTDSFRVEPHPDRHDMAAAQREYALDAALLQKPCDQCGCAIRRDFHYTTPVKWDNSFCVKVRRDTLRAVKR